MKTYNTPIKLDIDSELANTIAEISKLKSEKAKETWISLFDSTLHALLDYEMSSSQMEQAVEKASLIADLALNKIEERFAGIE